MSSEAGEDGKIHKEHNDKYKFVKKRIVREMILSSQILEGNGCSREQLRERGIFMILVV